MIDDISLEKALSEASGGFPHHSCPDDWFDCDCARVIAEQWTDPTPLDLDTLRVELGEPTNDGPHLDVWRTDDAHIACYEGQVIVCDRFVDDNGEETIGDYVKAVVRRLGALRMALQVIADEAKD